jgi:hypothetical protein
MLGINLVQAQDLGRHLARLLAGRTNLSVKALGLGHD